MNIKISASLSSPNDIRTPVVVKNILLILLLLAFFGLKLFPIKVTQLDFILLPILLFVVGFSYQTKTLYSKLILIYTGFVLLSCLYSYFFNHQALYLVVPHSYKYFSLLFFFYLVKSRITAKEAERILITIAIICCCCYILQWLLYPTILFYGAEDENKASLNYYRVRIPGSLSCYCLLLYGINKYILNRKIKNILYMILGGIPIIIMGFRTLTTLAAAFSFLMIPFVARSGRRTIVYSILAGSLTVAALQTHLVQSKLEEMGRRQKGLAYAQEDYIRFREFDYYWNDYFKKPGEKVIGGGVPVDTTTKYRKYINENKFAWTDLGLLGLSMIIGIPAVLLLIILYLICLWRFKTPQLQYLRFTLLIVLLGSLLTTSELYRDGNIILFTLFLYIEYDRHRRILQANRIKRLLKRLKS